MAPLFELQGWVKKVYRQGPIFSQYLRRLERSANYNPDRLRRLQNLQLQKMIQHCYLNIPDTSGRDSLFQAESRRCKEILDCITANSTKRHFGIFDELYSGTNPYEAVASAYGYIHHISGMKNVDFMLTTHYISLCELFEPSTAKEEEKKKRKDKKDNKSKSKDKNGGNPNIRNLHMKTTIGESGTDHVYHYKVVHGISKVRGGLKVLVDLNYPDEIIQTTKYILDKKK